MITTMTLISLAIIHISVLVKLSIDHDKFVKENELAQKRLDNLNQ